jgi:hypothetical protein
MFAHKARQGISHDLLGTSIESCSGEEQHCAQKILLLVARCSASALATQAVVAS